MPELCQNYKYQIYNNIITINISLSKYILQQDVKIFYKLWLVTVSEAGSQPGRPRWRETSSSVLAVLKYQVYYIITYCIKHGLYIFCVLSTMTHNSVFYNKSFIIIILRTSFRCQNTSNSA